MDECHHVLNPDHPYNKVFGEYTQVSDDIDSVWNRDPSYYADFQLTREGQSEKGYRTIGLTSTILPAENCTDPEAVSLSFKFEQFGVLKHTSINGIFFPRRSASSATWRAA